MTDTTAKSVSGPGAIATSNLDIDTLWHNLHGLDITDFEEDEFESGISRFLAEISLVPPEVEAHTSDPESSIDTEASTPVLTPVPDIQDLELSKDWKAIFGLADNYPSGHEKSHVRPRLALHTGRPKYRAAAKTRPPPLASVKPAPEPHLKRPRKNCLDFGDSDHYPSRKVLRACPCPYIHCPYVPPPKRYKTFDIPWEDIIQLAKLIAKVPNYPGVEHPRQVYHAVLQLVCQFDGNGKQTCWQTRGATQRLFERIFGFTPLDFGQRFRGWDFGSAYGFPQFHSSKASTIAQSVLFTPIPLWQNPADRKFSLSDITERRAPQVVTPTARRSDPFHYSYELYKYLHTKKPEPQNSEMATVGDSQLFDEHFLVTSFDQSKYDRVARIGGSTQDNQTVMTLDINTELYPCSVGENLHVVLASSLSLDGSKDDGKGWRDVSRNGPGGETTLADMFEYVCHGKIYKFEDGEDGQTIKAYISFGGLLMALEGPYKKLTPLRVDYVYLLVKK